MLLKFTYYAQEQELLSNYCGIYIQFSMSNSLHVTNFFIKTVLLEWINKAIKYINMLNHTMTVLLEYIDHSLQFSTNV